MFVVMNRIAVKPEAAEGFETMFAKTMDTLADVPGHLRSTLLRPTKADVPYVSTMEFTSRDAFMAWMQSDAFRAAHSADGAEMMTGANTIETFELVRDAS